jgi:iron complex outermembrane receptor protein
MKNIRVLRSILIGSASVFALSGIAIAQVAADSGVEQVVVSSTRITTGGFDAPTPTTVLGADEIMQAAQPSIENAIVELPVLSGSRTTTQGNIGVSGGGNGIQTLGLRNLGPNRTLVLLNGQRMVPAAPDGTVDIGQLPTGLIQRVDVVIGGASASWGSDAVAGVVNFVLDKKFSGFKANISGGISDYGDDANGLVQLSAGTDFAHSKGHVEVSGEFNNSDGVPHAIGSRQWYKGAIILQQTIAQTPPGTPEFLVADHVSLYQFTPGGIITAGPLKGINFGNGGTVSNFVYGSPIVGQFMVGGDQTSAIGKVHGGLDPAEKRGTFYGRVSYELSPTTSIYADFMYGEEHNRTLSVADQYQQANLTMQCGNPFLPASVKNACTTNNITSFQYGTNVQDIDIQSPVGGDNAVVTRTMHRATIGGDGAFSVFGSDWTWDFYGEHGWNDISDYLTNMLAIPLFKAAIDVTTDANGSPQCRSSVARAQGCLPLNIFGYNVADPRALTWVEGNPNRGPFLNTQQREEMLSFSVNGEPLSDWAGAVSVAAGLEYREEGFAQQDDGIGSGNVGNPSLPTIGTNNPLLSPSGNNWQTGNFRAAPAATYHVAEAFAETVIPLVKDDVIGVADLNLAGRATEYSSAGYVSTWKVGITYAPAFLNGVKFRALQSRDVRAPNLSELSSAGVTGYGDVIDDFAPYAGQQFNVYGTTSGNPNLKPEKGQTTEVGIVLSPSWFPGFNTSIDYYRIGLKGGVGSESTQQEMDTCFAGNQEVCKLITFDANKQPTAILSTKINLASIVTDGFDFESSYRTSLDNLFPGLPGDITLRSLATHASKFITDAGIAKVPLVESAGVNGGNLALWKWLGSQTYSTDRWSATLTEHYISSGVLSKAYIQCTTNCPVPTINNPTITENSVPGAFYLDVGGTYNLTPETQMYFKIDNVTNLDPPTVPSNQFNVNGSNPGLYDTIGRYYRIGARLAY